MEEDYKSRDNYKLDDVFKLEVEFKSGKDCKVREKFKLGENFKSGEQPDRLASNATWSGSTRPLRRVKRPAFPITILC